MKKITCLIFILIFFPIISVFADSTGDLLEQARYFKDNNFRDSAAWEYQQVMDQDPHNPDIIKEYADFVMSTKDYAFAISLYRKYLVIKPYDLPVRNLIMDALAATNLNNDAIAEGKDILKIYPDNIETLYRLKDLYYTVQGFEEEAGICERLYDLQPGKIELLKQTVSIYSSMGEFGKAGAVIEKHHAWDLFPKQTVATIYMDNENYKKAVGVYSEICRQCPTQENLDCLEKAKLALVESKICSQPQFSNFHYDILGGVNTANPQGRELAEYMKNEVGGLYGGYDFSTGRISGSLFDNHFARLYYPILQSNTQSDGFDPDP